MKDIYVNMKVIVVLKGEWNFVYVLGKCLGWICTDDCLGVDILRLSRICGLKEFIVMDG